MIWTHYGRWSNDGLVVFNNDGRIIYRLADSVHQRAVLQGAVSVEFRRGDDPAQDGGSRPIGKQG